MQEAKDKRPAQILTSTRAEKNGNDQAHSTSVSLWWERFVGLSVGLSLLCLPHIGPHRFCRSSDEQNRSPELPSCRSASRREQRRISRMPTLCAAERKDAQGRTVATRLKHRASNEGCTHGQWSEPEARKAEHGKPGGDRIAISPQPGKLLHKGGIGRRQLYYRRSTKSECAAHYRRASENCKQNKTLHAFIQPCSAACRAAPGVRGRRAAGPPAAKRRVPGGPSEAQ